MIHNAVHLVRQIYNKAHPLDSAAGLDRHMSYQLVVRQSGYMRGPGPSTAANDAKAGFHGALKPAQGRKEGPAGISTTCPILKPRVPKLLPPSFPSLTWGFPRPSEATHAQLPLPTTERENRRAQHRVAPMGKRGR